MHLDNLVNIILCRGFFTYDRVNPSGAMFLFAMVSVDVGPIAAKVRVANASRHANSNLENILPERRWVNGRMGGGQRSREEGTG